jgi:hypothetical protein
MYKQQLLLLLELIIVINKVIRIVVISIKVIENINIYIVKNLVRARPRDPPIYS